MLKQLREHAPAYGPSVQNTSGSPIEKFRAVQYVSGGLGQAVAVATAPTDTIAGMSSEVLADGRWHALRVSGIVGAVAGDVVVEGDRLVPSTDGKLVPAGSGEEWMAVAMTAAAGDGDEFEAELRLSGGALLP